MQPLLFLVYGVAAYAAFLLSFVWAIGFVEGIGVPGLDAQPRAFPPLGRALALDLLLLGAFGISHSAMARPAFKRWLTAIVPPPIERSTFVLVASVLLMAVCRGWQPLDGVLWQLEGTPRALMLAVSALGWGTVLVSTFLIDHFELFGLRQSWHAFRGTPPPPQTFGTPGLYAHARHPIYLGFVVAFWAAERMTWSHLLFAAVTTAYIAVAARLEERDLVTRFGDPYRDYQRRVPMLVPGLGRKG